MTASAERSKRVLFVIGSLEIGGAELQMAVLAENLVRLDCEVSVFSLEGAGPLLGRLKAAGIRFVDGGYDIRRPRPVRVLQFLRACLRLTGVVRSLRPEIVHGWLPLANFLASLAGRVGRVPLTINSKRALGNHLDRFPAWRPFERIANALCDRIVANSEAVKEDVIRREGVLASKLVVVHNSVRFVPPPEGSRIHLRENLGVKDRLVMLTTANLIPYKGHRDLLEALAHVSCTERVVGLFVGEDRGIGSELAGRARELGLERCVRFLGPRSDVPALLAAADLFVLPSHEEGFSNALLEAMAAGLPVIATSVGGNAEALGSNGAGRLVPPRDPEALAAAIRELLEDESLRCRLGEAARQRVEREFTEAAMVNGYLDVYGTDR